jgi:hypothetical protein
MSGVVFDPVTGAVMGHSHNPYVAIIGDQKSAGVAGGSFPSGGWRTRDINTKFYDPQNIVTVSSNQFSLKAGKYLVLAFAQIFVTNRTQIRLQNITDGVTTIAGASSFAGGEEAPHLIGGFSIADEKTFELQSICYGTSATYGFGVPTGDIVGGISSEVYCVIKIVKV